jgi:hypothetical protein
MPATRTPCGIVAGVAVVVVVPVVVGVVVVAGAVVVATVDVVVAVEVVTSAITTPENVPAAAIPSTNKPAQARRFTARQV